MFETGRTLTHYVESYVTAGLLNLGYSFFTITLEYEIKPA